MGFHRGPSIITSNLDIYLDAANKKSALRTKQSSNILVDPSTWSEGTGSSTGYNKNGDDSEQLRTYINDDPWNRRSLVWRTTPDAVFDADGGWNTDYYSIDTTFDYRVSLWVRRYTTSTGGTFYLGINPPPIKNSTGLIISNPYFTTPAISLLNEGDWYLVVNHIFNKNYRGGRHPDSGYYLNGNRISSLGDGNIGSAECRWDPSTTNVQQRAYHYYTTDINSGLEFCYPRIDKLDGTEPKINDLINIGESGWTDIISRTNYTPDSNINFTNYNESNASFSFNGVNDYINSGTGSTTSFQRSVEMVFKASVISDYHPLATLTRGGNQLPVSGKRIWLGFQNSKFQMHGWGTTDPSSTTLITIGEYYHVVYSYDQVTKYHKIYVNGKLEVNLLNTQAGLTGWNDTSDHFWFVGGDPDNNQWTSTSTSFNGELPLFRVYSKILSDDEVSKNFNSIKSRYNL